MYSHPFRAFLCFPSLKRKESRRAVPCVHPEKFKLAVPSLDQSLKRGVRMDEGYSGSVGGVSGG